MGTYLEQSKTANASLEDLNMKVANLMNKSSQHTRVKSGYRPKLSKEDYALIRTTIQKVKEARLVKPDEAPAKKSLRIETQPTKPLTARAQTAKAKGLTPKQGGQSYENPRQSYQTMMMSKLTKATETSANPPRAVATSLDMTKRSSIDMGCDGEVVIEDTTPKDTKRRQ